MFNGSGQDMVQSPLIREDCIIHTSGIGSRSRDIDDTLLSRCQGDGSGDGRYRDILLVGQAVAVDILDMSDSIFEVGHGAV